MFPSVLQLNPDHAPWKLGLTSSYSCWSKDGTIISPWKLNYNWFDPVQLLTMPYKEAEDTKSENCLEKKIPVNSTVGSGLRKEGSETSDFPPQGLSTFSETSTIVTKDIRYDYFPTIRHSTDEELALFYPERTVYFHKFPRHQFLSVISRFVNLFGDVSALKIVRCKKALRAIAVFKERADALCAILYLRKNCFAEFSVGIYADFVWTSDHNDIYEFEEVFRVVDGEAVSSNTVVSALVTQMAQHKDILKKICVGEVKDILKKICVGEVKDINLLPINEKYSLIEVEFVDPLDAAVAACCSFDRQIVLSSFYGKLCAEKMIMCKSNDCLKDFIDLNFSGKINRNFQLQLYEEEFNNDISWLDQGVHVVNPSDIIVGSTRGFDRPLYFSDSNPVIQFHIQIRCIIPTCFLEMNSKSGLRTCESEFIMWIANIYFLAYCKSKDYASVVCFRDTPTEIMHWISCFIVDVTVDNNRDQQSVEVTLRDMNHVLIKTYPRIFQSITRNFAILSPFVEDEKLATEGRPLNVETTDRVKVKYDGEKVFIYLPSNDDDVEEYGKSEFSIPFIFQHPNNFFDLNS